MLPSLPQFLPEEIRDLQTMQLTVRGALLGSVKRAEGTSNCVYRCAVKPGDVLQVSQRAASQRTQLPAMFFSHFADSVTLCGCLVLFGPVWPGLATPLDPHAGFCGALDNVSYKTIDQYAARDAVCVTADVCHGSCRQ